MPTIKLWGFNGSTYVRTIRMLLAEKGVSDYEQVPVNVLKGEPKSEEHRRLHPFGKVPVVEVDGFRIIETAAIARYLDAVLPGKALVPAEARDAARMDMITNIVDGYTYGPVVVGVVGYHLFPDFIGGKNEDAHRKGIEDGRSAFTEIFRIKGDSPWLAGGALSLADLYLAPLMAYVAMTPHLEEFAALPGVAEWWSKISALESFRSTAP